VTSPPALPEITMPPDQPRVQAAATGPPDHKALLLFAGKGGVGKTTLACATSLRLAQDSPAQEVLLLSADPAHSLSACLGASVGREPRRLCPGLTALEVNGEAEFLSLKQLYRQELQSFLQALSPDIDLTFDRITMERLLDLSPPGLDEVMALLRVMDLCEQGHYRTLVLDCAPTGHLIRLLEMPELIEQWLKVFFDLFLKYKRLFRLPRISQRLVEMSKALKRLRTLLGDPALCSLYGVTILTGMAFEETKDLLAACQRLRVPVPVLFLNLATPPSDCPLCSSLRHRETEVEQRYERTFPHTARTLVYRQAEPRGLARLGELGQLLYKTQPERT
jgi:arsenite-transporting ATPase